MKAVLWYEVWGGVRMCGYCLGSSDVQEGRLPVAPKKNAKSNKETSVESLWLPVRANRVMPSWGGAIALRGL